MSVQLFKTDYMSVVGEYYEKAPFPAVPNTKDSNWKLARDKYIHLFFTIQINGKIKTTQHYLKLIKDEWVKLEEESETVELWISTKSSGLMIENWESWYAIRNTLSDLWYPLGCRAEDAEPRIHNVIKWIDKAYNASQDPHNFHF